MSHTQLSASALMLSASMQFHMYPQIIQYCLCIVIAAFITMRRCSRLRQARIWGRSRSRGMTRIRYRSRSRLCTRFRRRRWIGTMRRLTCLFQGCIYLYYCCLVIRVLCILLTVRYVVSIEETVPLNEYCHTINLIWSVYECSTACLIHLVCS